MGRVHRLSLALLSSVLLLTPPATAPAALPSGPISSLWTVSTTTLKPGVTLTHYRVTVSGYGRTQDIWKVAWTIGNTHMALTSRLPGRHPPHNPPVATARTPHPPPATVPHVATGPAPSPDESFGHAHFAVPDDCRSRRRCRKDRANGTRHEGQAQHKRIGRTRDHPDQG